MNKNEPNFAALYSAWFNLKPGAKADLRRISEPDELLDLAVFYRLVEPFGWHYDLPKWEKEAWQRLVYLLSNGIRNQGNDRLGQALARSTKKVSDKRLFQIVRADYPNDIIQLRRVVKQADPNVNWLKVANLLWHWNDYDKRRLMEDFVLNQID